MSFRVINVIVPISLGIITIGIIRDNIGVSADQICQAISQGQCPSETCCKQSVCDSEGGSYRCCDGAGLGCSNCPKCVDCQWEQWAGPSNINPATCGNGLQRIRRVGNWTRKHKSLFPDGSIKSPGGLCRGEIINGTEYDTKKPWAKDCPEHCQLSNWTCTEWSNAEHQCGERTCTRSEIVPAKPGVITPTTNINVSDPIVPGDSCETVGQCSGNDCFSKVETQTCEKFKCTSGESIPLTKQCDGHKDCTDGSDEDCSPNPVPIIIGVIVAVALLGAVSGGAYVKRDSIKARLNV